MEVKNLLDVFATGLLSADSLVGGGSKTKIIEVKNRASHIVVTVNKRNGEANIESNRENGNSD